MTVNMKVKHLVYSTLAFLAALALLVIVIQPQLSTWQIERLIAGGNYDEGKQDILERIESQDSGYLELIETYMIEADSPRQEDIHIGPSMHSFAGPDSNHLFTREEAAPYLKEYLDEGDDPSLIRDAALLLMAFHTTENGVDEVQSTNEQAMASLPAHTPFHDALKIEEARFLMELGEPELAEEKLINLEEEDRDVFSDILLQTGELRARILQKKGEATEALLLLEERLNDYEVRHGEIEAEMGQDHPDYEPLSLDQVVYFEQATRFKDQLELLDNDQDMATVKGQVKRSDGEPLAHVSVYLRDESKANQSVSTDEPLQTTTDAEGNYRFDGVIPDTYQVHLGLRFDQVDGWAWPVSSGEWLDAEESLETVYDITFTPLMETQSPVNHETISQDVITFDWEEVDGAESYSLQLNVHEDSGSYGQTIANDIPEANHSVSKEELFTLDFGVVYDPENEEFISPESYLAFSYPDGEYSWQVSAYNADGEPIAQSNGYRLHEDTIGDLPFFQLDGRELTEEDRILLDEDLMGAIAAYEEAVEEDPEDLHSLRMPTRINGFSDEHMPDTIAYRRQLQDVAPSSLNVSHLFGYAMDESDFDEAYQWKQVYLELNENDEVGDYLNGRFGLLLAYLGMLEPALERLNDSVSIDGNNRFTGARAVVMLAAGDNLTNAIHSVEDDPERCYTSERPEQWARHLEALEELDNEVIQSAAEAMLALDDRQMNDLKQQHPALSSLINAWQEADW